MTGKTGYRQCVDITNGTTGALWLVKVGNCLNEQDRSLGEYQPGVGVTGLILQHIIYKYYCRETDTRLKSYIVEARNKAVQHKKWSPDQNFHNYQKQCYYNDTVYVVMI